MLLLSVPKHKSFYDILYSMSCNIEAIKIGAMDQLQYMTFLLPTGTLVFTTEGHWIGQKRFSVECVEV